MTTELSRKFTRAEAGERTGLSSQSVGRLIRRGELPEHSYSDRGSRVSEAGLIASMATKRRVRR